MRGGDRKLMNMCEKCVSCLIARERRGHHVHL